MKKLHEWPAALRKKWLLSCAAGAGCLLVGIIVSAALQDRPLLILSILLALGCTVRCIRMYGQIAAEAYEIVEGVCIRLRKIPLRKLQDVCLLTGNGAEHSVMLSGQTPIRIGNCYRMYFSASANEQGHPVRFADQHQFLALEDLGAYSVSKETAEESDP